MNNYLIDTNIIIYHLNGESIATEWLLARQDKLAISVITKIEVLSYPFEKEEEKLALKFLHQFELINISEKIIKTNNVVNAGASIMNYGAKLLELLP